jgi:CubicO group peptidase (beta-lactamase class C family)
MIRTLIAALALVAAAPAAAQNFDAAPILKANGFDGFALVARGDTVVWQTPRATCAAARGDAIAPCDPCDPCDPAVQRWPWASVTKQVMAVLTMMEVDRGKLALDAPASRYLPAVGRGAPSPTIRQLIQHRAGLRNPNDTPTGADGWPAWYTNGTSALGWCLEGRGAAGGEWRYNNCDTIVLGAVLEKVSGRRIDALFARRIAKPLGLEATGFVSGAEKAMNGTAVEITPQERAIFTRFGAAGGLIGAPSDLLKLDRALLTGKLLSEAARAEMWKGDPKLGFMALGQWAFDAPLKGCAKPVRLIERRGAIGRFQVRNILIPDRDMTVMLFTAVPEGQFDFGEVWQGKGLSHDLLAAAACA